MFIILSVAVVFCCYLNYTFKPSLSQKVFYMFLIAFASDQLILRTIYLLLYSLLKTCISRARGYKKLDRSSQYVMNGVKSAIKDMFTKDKVNSENKSLNNSRVSLGKSQNKELIEFNSFVDNLKVKGEIPDEDYHTEKLFGNEM